METPSLIDDSLLSLGSTRDSSTSYSDLFSLLQGAKNPGGSTSQTVQPINLESDPIATTPADLKLFPEDFMLSVTDFGAIPDDGKDDTAAIQAALDYERRDENGNPIHGDFFGLPKHLYFPKGVYDISNTIDWVGNAVTLQGQGSNHSILRLSDNSPGFNNPEEPKVVLHPADNGNVSFRQNIWNLGIEVGNNNPGAIGLRYTTSNQGSVRDVSIRSVDGQGFIGLEVGGLSGPGLIKDVEIEGFDFGIKEFREEYGHTLENIRLENQGIAGIYGFGSLLHIRGLYSNNSVPAVVSEAYGTLFLVDAELNGFGEASNQSALWVSSELFARNIKTTGYDSALVYQEQVVPGAELTEFASNSYHLFNSPEQSLNLEIKETPENHDNNLENWAAFEPRWYGDTGPLQDLLNSSKSTIYFPAGRYFAFNQAAVTVPSTVNRIVGFSSVVNRDGRGQNGGGIKFVIEDIPNVDDSTLPPLIIEEFGYGVTVEHKSSRPVAIKHGQYTYISNTSAGDLFLEDVILGPFTVQPGQNVWARQFDNEYYSTGINDPKIMNNGGNLWILGLKTEAPGTVINTRNGGKTELIGGFLLPVTNFTDAQKQVPVFVVNNSEASLGYQMRTYNASINNTQVEARYGQQTQRLETTQFGPIRVQIPLVTVTND
jgi:hypothetical protein